MKIGAYEFTPSLSITVLFLVVFAILLSLGHWQLRRADEKIELTQAYETALSQDPVELHQVSVKEASSGSGTRVRVRGRFEPARQLLWDNRVFNGVAGYNVVTPFKTNDDHTVLLVDRGWVAAGLDRDVLPDISMPVVDQQAVIELVGVLTSPSIGFSRGDAIESVSHSTRWPRRLQHFDYQEIARTLEMQVMPVVLQVQRSVADSTPDIAKLHWYADNWQPVAHGPEKHYGYAFQWFAMALALTGLYIFWNTRKVSETLLNQDGTNS